ncbi:MAG: hypothetical protein M5R42_05435 [Rhodocyclaceae bacterium]|nr:hypothetical protein [Rhodocyclaceae bacterium]
MTHGTAAARVGAVKFRERNWIDSHQAVQSATLKFILPVPHDAREPVQFVFSDGRHGLW